MELSPEVVKMLEQFFNNFGPAMVPSVAEQKQMTTVPKNVNLVKHWIGTMTMDEDSAIAAAYEEFNAKSGRRPIGKCMFTRFIILHYLKNKDSINLFEFLPDEDKRRRETHYNWRKGSGHAQSRRAKKA